MTSNQIKVAKQAYDLTIAEITCPILKQNVKNFSDQFVQNPEVLQSLYSCLLYTSPSPRDRTRSRMPSSA